MKHTWIYSFLIGLMILLVACEGDITKESVVEVDSTLRVPINRFDLQIMDIDANDINSGMQKLESTMPAFTDLYFSNILDQRSTPRETIIKDILSDTSYRKLHDVVQESFAAEDLGNLNSEITQGLKNYLHVFKMPESELPSVYTFISGFVYQSLVFQDGEKEGVALGLEMFLGNQFPYKETFLDNPMFSDYLTRTYNKDHLSKRIIEVLVEDKMPPPAKGDFLSLMIWGGKKLYIMDQILDFKSDTIVTEYTQQQMAWCKQNEAEIWGYFFDKDLFYKTDMRSFSKLIGPAPTSPGMPPESPGGTGNYMGWRVVSAYMIRYPETSIKDLLNLRDAQKLLDDSKYKPRI